MRKPEPPTYWTPERKAGWELGYVAGEDALHTCEQKRGETIQKVLQLQKELIEAEARGREKGIEDSIEKIRGYLLFDSQRAVSRHEVQDCIEAIRALLRKGE
jgi:hypothetical protein